MLKKFLSIYIFLIFFLQANEHSCQLIPIQLDSIERSQDFDKLVYKTLIKIKNLKPIIKFMKLNFGLYKDNGFKFYEENYGLVEFFSHKIKTDKNLKTIVQDFYRELKLKDLEHKINNLHMLQYPLGFQANLCSFVGDKDFKDFEINWLWNLAMKYSQNDPNLALFLIGSYGHDNFHYSNRGIEIELTEKYIEMIDQLEKEADIHIPEQFGIIFNKTYINPHEYVKSLIQNSKNTLTINNFVNRSFITFIPGSINCDIDANTKKEIAAIQSTIDGANLPAKYFHIYASSFVSCYLYQNGLSKEDIIIFQMFLAKKYRIYKLLLQRNYMLNLSKNIRRAHKKVSPDISYEDFIFNFLTGEYSENFNKNLQKVDLDTYFGILDYRTEHLNKTDTMKAIQSFFYDLDSFELFSIWRKSKLDLNTNFDYLKASIPKPSNMTEQRYESALKKLQTWIIDIVWTMTQHKVGASWGLERCLNSEDYFQF